MVPKVFQPMKFDCSHLGGAALSHRKLQKLFPFYMVEKHGGVSVQLNGHAQLQRLTEIFKLFRDEKGKILEVIQFVLGQVVNMFFS